MIEKGKMRSTLLKIFEVICIAAGLSFYFRFSYSTPLCIIFVIAAVYIAIVPPVIKDGRSNIAVLLLSALFTVFLLLGKYSFLTAGRFNLLVVTPISAVGLFLVLRFCLSCVFNWSQTVVVIDDAPHSKKTAAALVTLTMVLCMAVWGFYLLTYYPASLFPDSINQTAQALGDIPLSNHHPVVHTMLIRLFVRSGKDLAKSLTAYTVFQMLAMAAIFADSIRVLYLNRVKPGLLAALAVLIAIFPVNAMYSITVWKDTLFGGIVLMFVIALWQLTQKDCTYPLLIKLTLVSICLCLFRSNGFYAFLLTVPFMIILIKGKKNRRRIILSVAASLAVVIFIKFPVFQHFNIADPDTIEGLSMPAQHIARSVKDGVELTDEEYELLSHVIDVSKIAETYKPHISDPIKHLVRDTGDQQYLEEHKADFLKLWIRLGLRSPKSYICSQIDMTIGYWFPDVHYWTYRGHVVKNSYGLTQMSKVPAGLLEGMNYFIELYTKIPLIGIFWECGIYTWIMLTAAGVFWAKKKNIIMFIPLAALVCTLFLATPVHAEYRYIYYLVTSTPFVILMMLSDNKPCCKKEEQNEKVTDNN